MTRIRTVSFVVAMIGAAPVAAQQAAAPAPPPPPATKLSLDFGLVATRGNTDLTTTSFGEKFEWTPQSPWSLTEFLNTVQGKQDSLQTVDQTKGQVQPRYNFSPKLGVYALAGYERNRFAGLAWQWQEGAGLAYHAVKSTHHQLDLEAGAAFNQQQNYLVGAVERLDFPATRAYGSYKYSFTEKSYAYENFEWNVNLKNGNDRRVNSETGLVAPVVSAVAIKVTYVLRYIREPVAGFKTTDRTLTTGIQVTF